MPLTETDITLVCVSNEVGGTYAGNARWLGAPLAALLRRAGVQAGADQVLSAAADGMTISTPLATIMDGRNALLAVGMNGQPLPIAHGFPARMLVPGLYGYVSATKWVTRLTVTTFARQRAYWTQRGYAAAGAHQDRIADRRAQAARPGRRGPDTGGRGRLGARPRHRRRRGQRGQRPVAPARLAAADGIDTWRQWMWAWDATPGLHQLQVRATDNAGVDPDRRARPASFPTAPAAGTPSWSPSPDSPSRPIPGNPSEGETMNHRLSSHCPGSP